MEIGVGKRCIPADDHIVADPQLQLAQKHGVREIAVVADRYLRIFAEGKVDALHRAATADDKRLLAPATEALERMIACQHRTGAEAHIAREFSRCPPIRFAMFHGAHTRPPLESSVEAP